jgi:hypothetical protein
MRIEKLADYLKKNDRLALTLFALVMAFGTYTCMYAFRKPIAAANFKGFNFWGIDFKVLALTAQVIGYTISKFIGIKFVSENMKGKRATIIFTLISEQLISLHTFRSNVLAKKHKISVC